MNKHLKIISLAIALVVALAACRKESAENVKPDTAPQSTQPKMQKISAAYPNAYYKGRRAYFDIIRDCSPISKGNCLEDIVITPGKYQLFVDGIEDAIVSNTVSSFFSKPENYTDIIPDGPFGRDVVKMLSSGQGSIKLVRTDEAKVILLGSDAETVDETNAVFAIPVIAQE